MIFCVWFLLAFASLHLDTGAAFPAPNGSHISIASRLHEYLMDDYNKAVRPVNNSIESVKLDFSFGNFLIEDLDEKNQAFFISGWLRQSWKDYGLIWNPEEFGGMDIVRVNIDDIWCPDITVYNSKDTYYLPPTHHLALVYNDGKVLWIPPVNIKTQCDLDLSKFPFDQQVCRVVFGSWVHNAYTVEVNSDDLSVEDLLHRATDENLEWELVNVTAQLNVKYYSGYMEPYLDITYKFTIRRRNTFVTHLFIGPSVVLCLVTPVVFLLPPGSGEKTIFGIGVLIVDALLLGELINYLPTAHPNLPFIAKYFVGNIVMASLSLAISAIIIGFWDKSRSRLNGPNAFLRWIFLGRVAKMMCVKREDFFSTDETVGGFAVDLNPNREGETDSNTGIESENDKKRIIMAKHLCNEARSEWRQLAIVFDRLLFIIYYIILAILTLSFARYM